MLTELMKRLRKLGIATSSNVCCSGCGMDEMDERLAKDAHLIGYCFVNKQDQRRLRDEGWTRLTVGARAGGDAEAVAKIVEEEAKAAGWQWTAGKEYVEPRTGKRWFERPRVDNPKFERKAVTHGGS